MTKKPDLTNITSGYASNATLNNNNDKIEASFENTLSLDGSTPNALNADLDLNNNDILNANALYVGGTDVVATTAASAAAALASENNAATSETNAGVSETNAASSAAAALVSENNAATSESNAAADLVLTNADVASTNADVVLTNADVVSTNADVVSTNADVVLTNADAAATAADLVQTNLDTIATAADRAAVAADLLLTDADTVATAADVVASAASAAAALVSENNAAATLAAALPKAGGQMTGNITMAGTETVDGRDLSVDGSKLDGIEALADVTDTTNVTAAGALMDSEVTNLAQVKAFNSSDYATAAQGTTADAALPKAGGTMTGNIVMSGVETVDGRDVSVDGTKLDGIEASADVTDTTNVTAAGALMDSEVTNLAQVKAFNSADYATAAQGVTADAALPKAGGALTGAVTTTSTFDGRDVATDGTKLDGIEASADVTDTTNVTSAGALMDSELTDLAGVKALDTTDILFADVTDVLQVGYTGAVHNAGTKSTGTYTPDEADGNFQRAVNGGAHTLAPPAVGTSEATSVTVLYTNNASAGAVTLSGFTSTTGAFTTTDGDDFLVRLNVVHNGTVAFSSCAIEELQ